MRALFARPDAPDQVIGEARWDGHRAVIDTADPAARSILERIFRPTSLKVDDPALRISSSTGPVVLPPGSLAWFRSAARARGDDEGLKVRLVPEGSTATGFDPAGTYRPFGEAQERRERPVAPDRTGP